MTTETVMPPATTNEAQERVSVRSGDLLCFPPVLDACCGSRMFWFDRKNPLAMFVDKRAESHVLCDGRNLEIAPDKVCDFTALPFPDDTFYLVVFDPPHMNSLGANSWLAKKYGRLIGDWHDEIAEGFRECLRVLKPFGTLIFKWNSVEISLEKVLSCSPHPPLFGHTTGRQAKTHWVAFLKPNDKVSDGCRPRAYDGTQNV